jgi:hypothetical protein
MRDKIAQTLRHTDKECFRVGSYAEYADDIVAALPGMIQPLVWRDSYGVLRAETPWGDYKVCGRILSLPLPMNPQQVHLDEQSAKAAANAHHAAQVMTAFGVVL